MKPLLYKLKAVRKHCRTLYSRLITGPLVDKNPCLLISLTTTQAHHKPVKLCVTVHALRRAIEICRAPVTRPTAFFP